MTDVSTSRSASMTLTTDDGSSAGFQDLPAAKPSLLSRISGCASAVTTEENMGTARPQKRSLSDDSTASVSQRRKLTVEKPAAAECADTIESAFAPWLELCPPCGPDTSLDECLHDELKAFITYIHPSDREREARQRLVERITELLRSRWSDAEVTVFGSSATGLELTGGDIDLVVAFDHDLQDYEKRRRLTAIGDILKKSGLTTWVNRILSAKVPIISFTTIDILGETSVDISIRNSEDSGPRAIPIVKGYLEAMPALRPLILCVKAFLSLRDLNDASQNTLSSYAITILCISFLQRNPSRRQRDLLEEPDKSKSLGLLLMDFFRHYGHDFSYATHYISVTDKGIFAKKLKNWESRGQAVLAVQCLLNPDNNITRGCSKIHLVVDAFKQAEHALQNVLSSATRDSSASLLCDVYDVPLELDARRRALESSIQGGAFFEAIAACTAHRYAKDSRSISGGVALAMNSRNTTTDVANFYKGAPRQYARSYQGRQAPTYTNGGHQPIQQLPPLRWSDSRFDFRVQQVLNYVPQSIQSYPGLNAPSPAQQTYDNIQGSQNSIYMSHSFSRPSHRK